MGGGCLVGGSWRRGLGGGKKLFVDFFSEGRYCQRPTWVNGEVWASILFRGSSAVFPLKILHRQL